VVIEKEYQEKPEEASRPFDTKRCGFVPSHGSGTIILEELESAKKRGAKIYAELMGVQANANANHLPAPSSANQIKLMTQLLQTAGVKPEEVNYVNCHATGTPLGDLEEIKAVKAVFGKHAYNMKLNAPKSMLGHVCWSAPIVESIGGILQMQHSKLHPTINIDELAPEVDLDVCADGPKDFEITYMLKNSFGFGGLNCCSLIKKYEE
ncbi:MAG: beta-ketoacyl-[acyl-carrier-protein] synthase family protein, partial [Spirochaetes bacterium]|nr:beta-ketoacyl-[acyl-carrier-protein] synthase family protein [Spirochaetota bacterium]